MAIEFVETASSAAGDAGASSSNLGAALTAPLDDLTLLDDWATGEQDHHVSLSGEADENMTAMWNMDSIDVASCFAGESSLPPRISSTGAGSGAAVTGHDVAAAIAEADPLFGTSLTQWWDQNDAEVGVAFDSKSAAAAAAAATGSTTYPSMSPLTTPIKQAAVSTAQPLAMVEFASTDKEVTDALLAVFAPHAVLSDDSQTDSGAESSSAHRLSQAASPASSVSSSSSYAQHGSHDATLVAPDSSNSSNSSSVPPLPPRQSKKSKAKTVSVKLELADDEKDLTPLEIRRKRNRESMQRARRRQRDDVEEMKETLHELELHYQKLSDAAQERRSKSDGSSGSSNAINGATASAASVTTIAAVANPSQQRLEADYYAAADLSHSLKEEKFLLEQMLTEKQKTYRRMQQVMVDRVQELELPCPTTTTPEALFTDFEFSPITEEQSNELIRQCYLTILQFQDAATPLTPPRGMKTELPVKPRASIKTGSMVTSKPFPPTATFGWKVSCHVTPDQNFFVSFAKYFKGVSAEEAMLNTWSRTLNPHTDRSPHRRLLRYQVLQVINDSTYVAGMDIHHPVKKGKQMRNTFCRFRLQTDEGVYVIGRASMNPKSPELRRQAEQHATFEYVDNYSWIEFSSVVDKDSGEKGVCVKFNARTEYNTQEDSHLRLVNSLFLTLKWESAVIPNAKPNFFLPS